MTNESKVLDEYWLSIFLTVNTLKLMRVARFEVDHM